MEMPFRKGHIKVGLCWIWANEPRLYFYSFALTILIQSQSYFYQQPSLLNPSVSTGSLLTSLPC